jgi:integrase
MSKDDSTAPVPTDKPTKPRPDFPLFPHATRRWAKKIRGKLHYFGPWEDPDAAEKKYEAQKADLHAGRKPREVSAGGVTVKELCNKWLAHKEDKKDAGELSPRTWLNYHETAELLIEKFGKSRLVSDLRPDDFAAFKKHLTHKKKWSPVRVGNYIQQVRGVFRFALLSELIDKPVNFGPGFARPSRKTLRLERAKKGLRMFEADELRSLIGGALVVGKTGPELVKPTTPLKAMILLAANCGYGNTDCATLPLSALDLEGGWVNYHRPKTGVSRRCPLWPETIAALREVLAERREPKDAAHKGLVFITQTGGTWDKGTGDNPISKEMRKLLDAMGLNGHRNFYALRHTFETIGGESRDQVAVDHIMGHIHDDMASLYRERISDERLKAVAEFVRKWIWPPAEKEVKATSEEAKPIT